jgi:FtsZ-binding cell division protein ZapB
VGIFGKSFNQKVQDAIDVINKSGMGVDNLKARIESKVVTLEGLADDMEATGKCPEIFRDR